MLVLCAIYYVLQQCKNLFNLPAQYHLLAPGQQQRAADRYRYTGSWMTSPLTGTAPILFYHHAPKTHTRIFIYLFFLNHCTNQQKYYSFTFLPQKNSMHFDISTFLTTHLQSVAIICSWHYDFLMIKQNVRISLQADGWGCVNLLGLPYLKTERTRYVNLT